jgi:hypothetical protein
MSTMPVTTITIATCQIVPMAIVIYPHVATVTFSSSEKVSCCCSN